MSALAKVAAPTVGTPLSAHEEEPERLDPHDEAISHFMRGRAQHGGVPRHFSFRPDSAGADRHLGFQKNMAPIVAMNAQLKEQVAELTKRCDTLLAANETLKKANAAMEAVKEENGKLRLKVFDLESALRKVAESVQLAAMGKV